MTETSSPLKYKDVIEEASLRYMFRLAGPMVLTTISFTIMQFVDRFMVSRLGSIPLAAILPAGFVSFVPGAFAIGALSSLNTFVSQSVGRGEKKSCSNYFWQSIFMGLVYFIVVTVVMWPTAPLIFKMMGQPPEVIDMEVIYLRILLYAHILAVFNWSSNQFFMGIHRPIVILYASLCGQVVNVVANYILIFGKLGLPEMGIAGAGWGTFIGITVAGGVNMYVFLGPLMNRVYKTRRTFNINFTKMFDLIRVGLPAGIGLMINVAFWGVILTSLVGKFGTQALAATGGVLAYTNLVIMPVVGLSTALTASAGKMIGQNKKEIVEKQTDICLRIAIVYMVFIGVLYFIFRGHLMLFWSSDSEVIEIGAQILICAAFYQLFHAIGIIYSGSLRGAGDTLWLAIVSAIGALLVLGVGGSIITLVLPSFRVLGPWIAATLSAVTIGVANRWRFKNNRWKEIDIFKRQTVDAPIQTEPFVE